MYLFPLGLLSRSGCELDLPPSIVHDDCNIEPLVTATGGGPWLNGTTLVTATGGGPWLNGTTLVTATGGGPWLNGTTLVTATGGGPWLNGTILSEWFFHTGLSL